MNKIIKIPGIFLIVIVINCFCNDSTAQSSYLQYKLSSAAYKNFALGALLNAKHFYAPTNHGGHPLSSAFKTDQLILYPGFGFSDFTPKFSIDSVKVNHHLPHLSLYELTLNINDDYKDIAARNAGFEYEVQDNQWTLASSYLYPYMWRTNRTLLGVDSIGKIYYISGFPINDPISSYFSIKPDFPKSYLSFLKYKMYSHADSFSFARQQGDVYYFQGYLKQKGGLEEACEIELNINDPDNSTRALKCFRLKPSLINGIKYPLEDKGVIQYRDYVLDALMKNIYAYRIYNWDAQRKTHNVKINSLTIEERCLPYIDSLLPNYDEYFKYAGVNSYNNEVHSGNVFLTPDTVPSKMQSGNLKNDDESYPYPKVWGFTREDPNLLFFKIHLSSDVVLYRNLKKPASITFDTYTVTSSKWFRHDLFWQKNLPRECDQTDVSSFKYYLIGLDIKSNRVYFISGDDIFLSNTTHLYFGTLSGVQEKEEILERELMYLQDRLYSLRVWDLLTEENIMYMDKDVITLRALGVFDCKEANLKITTKRSSLNVVEVQSID